jgi:hypothetical protein
MNVETPTRLQTLSRNVRERVPQPIDVLEIAAVIESMGITDTVAVEDYGVTDAFELAGLVFDAVRAWPGELSPVRHDDGTPDRERNALADVSARGLLALAPLCVLLIGLQALALAGWDTGAILALSIGVTASMLLTSGPIVAIGRRTSVYLGFEQVDSARRFITRASLGTLLACVAIGLAAYGLASALALLTEEQRLIFTTSLVAYALLWLLASGLSLAGASALVCGVLAGGLALAIGTGVAFGTPAGIGIGYGATVAVLVVAWCVYYPYRRQSTLLPRATGPLLLDSAPYVFFGTAFAMFLVGPHLLGWLGAGEGDGSVIDRVMTLELSLLIALVPVVLATGVSERVLRSFWDVARTLRRETAADGFRRGVRSYVLGGFVRYAVVLGALSLATALVYEALVLSSALDHSSQLVFLAGLTAFLLLGLGQFGCLFLLGLSLPGRAVRSLVTGLLVLGALGLPLALVDFRLAAVGFAVAAAVFAAAAIAACLTVLAEIPRRYSTAF